MIREELLDYTYFVIKHIERGVTPAWLVDKYMDAEHPLPPAEGARKVQWSGYGELGNISQKPTAEGAEEIRRQYWHYWKSKGKTDQQADILSNNPNVIEFATLHAQQIAEKMAEEKLREENEKLKDMLRSHNPFPNRPNPRDVNPYDIGSVKMARRGR